MLWYVNTQMIYKSLLNFFFFKYFPHTSWNVAVRLQDVFYVVYDATQIYDFVPRHRHYSFYRKKKSTDEPTTIINKHSKFQVNSYTVLQCNQFFIFFVYLKAKLLLKSYSYWKFPPPYPQELQQHGHILCT